MAPTPATKKSRTRRSATEPQPSSTTTDTSPRPSPAPKDTPSASSQQEQQPHQQQHEEEEKNESHATSGGSRVHAWLASQFDEIPIDGLVFFRILWGLLITYELVTYVVNDFSKLHRSFLEPQILFKYELLEWAQLPSDTDAALNRSILEAVVSSLVVSGVFVTIGFMYRLAAVHLCVGFVYLYALDAALYLNHFYLIAVFLVLLVFLPANRAFSIDAWLIWPRWHSSTMPRWVQTLLRFEQVLVYTYAGIAKINEDWLRAHPLLPWFSHYAQRQSNLFYYLCPLDAEPLIWYFAYGGIVYDLTIGFLLLFDRTFKFAIAASIYFHLLNKLIMNIGIFPWVMLASLTLFLRSDWPRHAVALVRRSFQVLVPPNATSLLEDDHNDVAVAAAKNPNKPFVVATPRERPRHFPPLPSVASRTRLRSRSARLSRAELLVLLLLLAFALHQLLVPLRHWLYRLDGRPNNVAWDECGHRYSWRMKLRDKFCSLSMVAVDRETNTSITVDAASFLYGKQIKIKSRPDLVVQLAHYVADYAVDKAYVNTRPEIYASSSCSLNGRKVQPFILPTVDLAQVDWRSCPFDWIVPLEPLSDQQQLEFPWNWNRTFSWINPANWRYVDVNDSWRSLAAAAYRVDPLWIEGTTPSPLVIVGRFDPSTTVTEMPAY